MIQLFGQTLEQLQALCLEQGFPRYTARQLCDWLYVKRVESIGQMTNLSLATRKQLSEVAVLQHMLPGDSQISRDGTRKYLFADTDGTRHAVEAVYIPEADRATLCVSCQRGCKMGCRFCVTGSQGFHGQLTTGEILDQLFAVEKPEQNPNKTQTKPSNPPTLQLSNPQPITNIVFMGMGEPMDNYDSVLAATEILTADWGMGWSPKRITVSTVGITPVMRRFLNESRCHLAVSLHNPFSDERAQLMPMEKAYPIAGTIDLLRRYDWSGQRRVSFEYIMFDGLNDSIRHADGLLRLLKGLQCRINLIRFHTSPDMPFHTSSDATIRSFQEHLNKHGITCTLRASRGEDIMAACGLLAGKKGVKKV